MNAQKQAEIKRLAHMFINLHKRREWILSLARDTPDDEDIQKFWNTLLRDESIYFELHKEILGRKDAEVCG